MPRKQTREASWRFLTCNGHWIVLVSDCIVGPLKEGRAILQFTEHRTSLIRNIKVANMISTCARCRITDTVETTAYQQNFEMIVIETWNSLNSLRVESRQWVCEHSGNLLNFNFPIELYLKISLFKNLKSLEYIVKPSLF